MKGNEIVSFIFPSDMRCGHEGLRNLAKRLKRDPNLKPGQFLVFLNSRQSQAKILTAGDVLLHLRPPGDVKLNLEAIARLPEFFGGGEFNYKDAVKNTLPEQVRRRIFI